MHEEFFVADLEHPCTSTSRPLLEQPLDGDFLPLLSPSCADFSHNLGQFGFDVITEIFQPSNPVDLDACDGEGLAFEPIFRVGNESFKHDFIAYIFQPCFHSFIDRLV